MGRGRDTRQRREHRDARAAYEVVRGKYADSEEPPALPVRSLGRIRYDSLCRIFRLTVPMLIAHSLDDVLIPFEQGKRLNEAAPEPKQFAELTGISLTFSATTARQDGSKR